MIRTLTSIVFLFTLIFGAFGEQVFAHVYLYSGTMEVFSHIDADDDPIIKEESTLYFIFTDSSEKFDSKLCDCRATIKTKDGEILFTQKLFETPDPSVAEFKYVFPEKGVYDIEIIGKPAVAGAFEPFETHRMLRVERESSESTRSYAGINVSHTILFLIAFAVIVLLFIAESARAKRAKTKGFSNTGLIIALAALSMLALTFHEVKAMELSGQMDCHESHECCKIQSFNSSLPFFDGSGARSIETLHRFPWPLDYEHEPLDDIQNKSPPIR